MSIVKMKQLLKNAQKGQYGIGAFSISNMETIIGAVRAAEELKSPIILQIAESRLKHSPLYLIGPVMIEAAKKSSVPIAVHLDHGESIDTIKEALDLGFTSVMYDGSHFNLSKNIENTKEVVSLTKEYGASVEGEVGKVGKKEDGLGDDTISITTVEDAEKFYKETNVDALAIAIGNVHGMYVGKPNLDIKRLIEVNSNIEVPLVLHGGSGITKEEFKNCIKNGITKINVATATFNSVIDKVNELFKTSNSVDYFTYHDVVINAAYDNVKKHIDIFGSSNKA
ncbi:ketose-bisphosphate aldolase [Clostridium tetani]|uniref:Fructose-bisphosphate aldolase n=1 Tax=Clostridium tetani (strain Massachusetts / E88) TaxID=212717 RepID=Q898F1_CLOTE|nr:class II fructose-bisphosphate aldolase [Clostridium tetani]AAO35130.1 fructose-bisphosphate aldolase [Clostridium tetani E88]KGI38971.1 fructose-bisphosphate aldolase [Clostridium tetani]KGI46107.1 fructose-bisphosphate aldolase [Clostridium tetani]KHO37959.1 fructose-bisphosphate aldolase [Clostridium tetani]KIG20214.1 fructose-bisphosphate aldolase [Clostridium tetani]